MMKREIKIKVFKALKKKKRRVFSVDLYS